jgi:hypothetical protein
MSIILAKCLIILIVNPIHEQIIINLLNLFVKKLNKRQIKPTIEKKSTSLFKIPLTKYPSNRNLNIKPSLSLVSMYKKRNERTLIRMKILVLIFIIALFI